MRFRSKGDANFPNAVIIFRKFHTLLLLNRIKPIRGEKYFEIYKSKLPDGSVENMNSTPPLRQSSKSDRYCKFKSVSALHMCASLPPTIPVYAFDLPRTSVRRSVSFDDCF